MSLGFTRKRMAERRELLDSVRYFATQAERARERAEYWRERALGSVAGADLTDLTIYNITRDRDYWKSAHESIRVGGQRVAAERDAALARAEKAEAELRKLRDG